MSVLLLFVPILVLNLVIIISSRLTVNAFEILFALLIIICVLALILFGSVYCFYLYNLIQNKKTDLKKISWETLKRLPWIILTMILYFIFQGGLFLLFIIPGLFVFYRWIFVPFAVILKKKHGLAAFNYSSAVTKGSWWTLFGYFSALNFLIYLVFWVILFIQIVITLPFISVMERGGSAISGVLLAIVTAALWLVFVGFAGVVMTSFFANFDHNRPKAGVKE